VPLGMLMGEYSMAWREYRKRHWAASVGLILGIPLAAVIAIFLKVGFGLGGDIVIGSTMAIWAALWGWLAFRVTRFPCPRCGAAFNSAHACEKCGLQLYEQA